MSMKKKLEDMVPGDENDFRTIEALKEFERSLLGKMPHYPWTCTVKLTD